MQLHASRLLLLAAAVAGPASAVPAAHHHHGPHASAPHAFDPAVEGGVFGPFLWASSKVVDTVTGLFSSQSAAGSMTAQTSGGCKMPSLSAPHFMHHGGDHDGEDCDGESLWEIINTRKEFSQLAHVLNYSSDSTKDLLANGTGLTLFAPVNLPNPHHGGEHGGHGDHGRHPHPPHHGHDEHGPDAVATEMLSPQEDVWALLDGHIESLESGSVGALGKDGKDGDDDDDKKRERRRKILAKIIDAVIKYHLVDADEPLTGRNLADNSSVATQLSTDFKKLNDKQAWRVKISQHLLPFPSIRLNYYSTVIRPDIKASNGLAHAIRFPLLPPPSILQALYFATPELAGTTLGLVKTGGEGYLALPGGPWHDNGTKSFNEDSGYDAAVGRFLAQAHSEHHEGGGHGYAHPGTAAATFIAPSNWAWRRLPPKLRLFLLSPFGERWLAKVFMLHALPHDIVFADAVHHVKAVKAGSASAAQSGIVDAWEETDVELPDFVADIHHHHPSTEKPHKAAFDWKLPDLPAPHFPGRPGKPEHGPEHGPGGRHPHPPPPPHAPGRGPHGGPHPPPPPGRGGDGDEHRRHRANVTHFTFLSALPKIDWSKHNGTGGGDGDGHHGGKQHVLAPPNGDGHEGAKKYETVDVDVYRYHILPREIDPVQTRVVVQGVPIFYQDIPAANGVIHVPHSFIMPKHLKNRHGRGHGRAAASDDGEQSGVTALWARIVDEAANAGFHLDEADVAALGL